MDDLLQAALLYADLGFRVFPLLPGQKTPATENGLLDATTDPAAIQETWGNHPYNIGIATDGLLIVDIDGRGNPWLSTLGERAYDLVGCPTVRTPSGGSHRYFRQPSGGGYRNTASDIAPRVDTRADGGYVVAPPSFLESGGGYQWVDECELTADLDEPPAWLLEKLKAPRPKESQPTVVDQGDGNPIPSGQRNATLARQAGFMRRVGFEEAEIVAALHAVNCSRCHPPLPAAEVEKIAKSISRYSPDQSAVAAMEGHYYEDRKPKSAKSFPVELLRPPGLLSDIIDYNLAGAYRQQPILALAGALALLATITGRRVQDEIGTRTNLYILGVAASGSGKERARVVNKELLFAAGGDKMLGPESPASDSGLVSAVHQQPAILLQWDEIGRLLQTMNGRFAGPHLANVSTVLMKLFTSSSSIFKGNAYAKAENNKTIDQPHAVLYGTTVPKNFYENMSADSISDGFMGRLLIFESETPSPDFNDPTPLNADPLVESIRQWLDMGGGNLSNEHPKPIVVPSSKAAAELFLRCRDAFLALERAAEKNAGLWTRAYEKARKLALLHACSRGGKEISLGDAEWGRAMALYLTERLSDVGEEWIADGRHHQNCNRIRRWLKGQPMQMASIRDISRHPARSMTRKERDQALDHFTDCGALRRWTEDTGSRPREMVQLIDDELSHPNQNVTSDLQIGANHHVAV